MRFEVEEIWTWRNSDFELEEIWIWSWRNLKFEVEGIWNLKLKKFEIEEIILRVGVRFSKFVVPTNVEYHFRFWKYSSIFLFSTQPQFGPFGPFWALRGKFSGSGQAQKLFWVLIVILISFAFDNIDIYKLESTILDGVGSVGSGRDGVGLKIRPTQPILSWDLGWAWQY